MCEGLPQVRGNCIYVIYALLTPVLDYWGYWGHVSFFFFVNLGRGTKGMYQALSSPSRTCSVEASPLIPGSKSSYMYGIKTLLMHPCKQPQRISAPCTPTAIQHGNTAACRSWDHLHTAPHVHHSLHHLHPGFSSIPAQLQPIPYILQCSMEVPPHHHHIDT